MTDRLYGNWLRPQRLSIRGVGWRGLLFATTSYFIGLATLQTYPRFGLGLLVAGILVTAASAIRIRGASGRDWLLAKLRWQRAQAAGSTSFQAVGADGWALPGLMAHTRMLDVEAGGRRFGVVHDPIARRLAVTLEVASMAADLTDEAEHDIAVGRWERWLEGVGRHPEVAWVTVVVDTSPSPGTKLRDAVERRVDPMSPADCRALLDTLIAASPSVAAGTQTRLTIVFDLRAWDLQVGRRARRDGVDVYLPLLDRAVAGLEASLDGCGVQVLRRSTEEALAGIVRVAFDPASSGGVELSLARRAMEWPVWELAGPSSARELRDRYVHDSGTSVSFVWAQAPRQLVPSTVLDPLTRPGRFRKRVAFTYVATATGEAMDAAVAQVRWRWMAEMVSRLPIIGRPTSAQDERDAAAAEQATREVAAGAGWVGQTISVTVTVTDETDLPAAVAELEHSAGAAQLRLRRLYDVQAAGFVTGLPAGLSLVELVDRWSR